MKTSKHSQIEETVLIALEEIRPYLKSDGGDIELINVDEDAMIVTVRLLGNCSSCAINGTTMKLGVENTIKKHLPEVKEVIKVD